MAQALGLKRLQELLQGTCNLSSEPAWVLGTWYGITNQDDKTSSLVPEVEAALHADFGARLWFTYRRDVPPIGGQAALTSDIGWGCTLRSGQMMLAEALMRHMHGRQVRRPSDNSSAAAFLDVLSLFQDSPQPERPFSIHALCRVGSPHGVVAGQWLGPWALCKALEAAVASQPQLGLQLHVVCDPGGGAPALALHRVRPLLQPGSCSRSHRRSSAGSSERELNTDGAAAGGVAAGGAEGGAAAPNGRPPSLLLLLPLTLGVGRINERYLPQLQALLTFPQSVGIVGGRPGASLYFVGYQGGSVMYLDPHDAQEAAQLPQGMHTFFCNTLRLMPLSAIDPSLAIGFICHSAGDLEDLAHRLDALASSAGGAPLVTTTTLDAPTPPPNYLGVDAADEELGDTFAANALEESDGEQEQQQPQQRDSGGEDWELV